MQFAKMEGLSNDFIVTHGVPDHEVDAIISQVPGLCHHRQGIGADSVILALPPTSPAGDFRMRIFNADGSEPEMCGNGVRCMALYVHLAGLSDSRELVIETLAGPIRTTLEDDGVRVDMGHPRLDASQIPVAKGSGRVVLEPVTVDGRTFHVTAVSMGNPHAVIYVDQLTDELVQVYGPRLEQHPFFPQRANVEFVEVLSERAIQVRVYERGCGETPACGTGACAAVVAGVLNQKHGHAVMVQMPGGELLVEWDGAPDHPVYMTGPARWVFAGTIEL